MVYIACIAALPRLHSALAEGAKPFALPGGYLIPLLAVLLCLWLITFAGSQSWLTTAIFSVLGTVFYALTRRSPPGS